MKMIAEMYGYKFELSIYDVFKIHKKPIPHLKKLQPLDLEGTFHFNTICVHNNKGLNII